MNIHNESVLGLPLAEQPVSGWRLAFVEDDPGIRDLLHGYLCRLPEFTCVIVANSMEAFWAELDVSLPPDLLLLDLNLPGQGGLTALPELRRRLPHAQVIVQTVRDEHDIIYQALRAGASGYLLKGATSLAAYRQALLDVAQGGAAISPQVARRMLQQFAPAPSQQPDVLTAREHEVLSELLAGLGDKQIAARLGVSANTVRTLIGRIYRKLRVEGRTELLSRAVRGDL